MISGLFLLNNSSSGQKIPWAPLIFDMSLPAIDVGMKDNNVLTDEKQINVGM